jgi:hypothetical protein
MPLASLFHFSEGLNERFALVFVFFFLGDFFRRGRLLAAGFFDDDFFSDDSRLSHVDRSRFSGVFLFGLFGFNSVLDVGSGVSGYTNRFSSNDGFNHDRGGFFSFLGQALGFTLAATHFTWVVRRAAIAGDGWSRFNVYFSNHNHFSHFYHWLWRRFGGDWRCFNYWRFSNGCFNWSRFSVGRCFHDRSRFCSRRGFKGRRLGEGAFSSRRFNGRGFNSSGRFNGSSLSHVRFHNSRLAVFGNRRFNCFVAWRLVLGNDFADGGSRGSRYNSGDSGIAGVFAAFLGARFFAAFDDVAVGITLTLTTVAATTLTTGATTWTIATFGVVLVFFVLFLGAQYFFFVTGGFNGWTRLTLFTRCTWLTLFARLTLNTLFARGFLALGV